MHRRPLLGAALAAVLLGMTPLAAPAAAQPVSSAPASSLSPGREPGLALEGTAWRLTELRVGAEPELRAVGPEAAARMTLIDGGALGSSGCNVFGGAYSLDGVMLRFEEPETTEQLCAERTMLVERALYDGLRLVAAYAVTPDDESWQRTLTLLDSAGEPVLRFRVDDAARLGDGPWQLERYQRDGRDTGALPGIAAVLAFSPQEADPLMGTSSGSVTGSTGCNSFSGTYAAAGSVLVVGPLARTEMGCLGELGAQENTVLGVLESPSLVVELPPGRLVVTAIAGEAVLTYVTMAPLEDRTWVLTRLRGERVDPRLVVTLRLARGTLTGEAPCGAYSGTYVSDGLAIRFDALDEGRGACDRKARRLGRAYLRGLRSVTSYALGGPDLRLLDANGEEVARFTLPGAP